MAKYIDLPRHPSDMIDRELRAYLAGGKQSEIMRGLILAEVNAIRNGAPRDRRTMRSLWYTLVKPALSQAGILNQKTRTGKAIDWAGKLSKYLAEAVGMGATSYEELAIIDGSRQRQRALSITKPIANVQLVGPHFPWIVIFTEKDTIWGEVEDLASLYGVSAISGGGFPSNACTENTVRAIVRSKAYREAQPATLVLLSLTDYDPMGDLIAGTQFDQIMEALNGIPGELCNLTEAQHIRLGLDPDQLAADEIERNAYEPKDRGLLEWLEKTGGIDGEPLGLELDALPLRRVRRMFAEGIERWVDLDKRRSDLREAFLDLLACELLKPDFEARRERLCTSIKSGDLWTDVVETPLPDGLFTEAAAAGYNAIDPLDLELFDCEAEVRAAMIEALDSET